MDNVNITPLTVGVAGAVAQSATAYSEKMSVFARQAGEACIYFESTAGNIAISQQVSLDGEKWFDPVDANGGIGTVIGNEGVTTGKYVKFTPVMAKYTRFKVVESGVAATVVTLKLLIREKIGR